MMYKNTKLRNDLKKIVKEHSDVEDILLFGSTVKGKEKPSDVDILVLFNNHVNKDVEYEIRNRIEKEIPSVSILSKTLSTSKDAAFDARESILFEAESLLTGQNLAEQWGFASLGLFKYSFSGWSKLQKVKFYHALNGRDGGPGIAEQLGCIKLSDKLILVPKHQIFPLQSFLDYWKIEYKYIPLLIPQRMNKKSLLE